MSDADCLHMAERIAERGYYPPGIARQYAAIMADGSRVDRLRDIALPFFVIHGDHDSLLPPPCGEDIVKNVQLAQWLLVDGMGHDMGPGIEAVITPAVCALWGLVRCANYFEACFIYSITSWRSFSLRRPANDMRVPFTALRGLAR